MAKPSDVSPTDDRSSASAATSQPDREGENPALRVEQAQAHLLIPRIVESFPELAQAVHFSKPSLEDVFLGKTGRRFEIGKKEGMGP